MTEGLPWPPRKEDLERLYLGQKLSAAKIAKVYGLAYKNPKVAESTILYQLKKFGIGRRDRAEHARKVTPSMVDTWVERYRSGESLKEIAETTFSPVTVWNHLRARGVLLRDRVDAQIEAVTKHRRQVFSGDKIERAYLMGLRYGDLNVVKHGRAVRVRVSTTHPAMADLFESSFSPYGYVHRYPRRNRLTGFEWSLECDLGDSFEFLLRKSTMEELEQFSPGEFGAFMAGLFDAEGAILLHKKRKWHNPEVTVTNSDPNLIDCIFKKLRVLGYASNIEWRDQTEDRKGIVGKSRIGRVTIWRFEDVQRFVRHFGFKHREKIAEAELVNGLVYKGGSSSQRAIIEKWNSLKTSLRKERIDFIRLAESEVLERGNLIP